MEARLVPYKLAPKIMQAMVEAEKAVSEAGLEYSLYELVRIRASQINGCAYCIHMHTRDARKAERLKNASTSWPRGANRRCSRRVNALRWPGPKP